MQAVAGAVQLVDIHGLVGEGQLHALKLGPALSYITVGHCGDADSTFECVTTAI